MGKYSHLLGVNGMYQGVHVKVTRIPSPGWYDKYTIMPLKYEDKIGGMKKGMQLEITPLEFEVEVILDKP